MLRTFAWALLGIVGLLAILAAVNNSRFHARVVGEARELWARRQEPRPLDLSKMDALPAPVRRYLTLALQDRPTAVSRVRLRHGGEFRTALDGSFVKIRGEQYFSADPPGFVWWGRIGLAPGLWVDARDRSARGEGSMLVRLESTFTLADARGPELDQGALLRLLAETTWLPTAFLDDRYIGWTAIDDRHARVTLRLADREVACTFQFGDDGLPARIEAARYRDLGNGRSVLTPWSGESSDYRRVDGLLVPHRQVAFWHVEGEPVAYARFEVERIEFDPAEPF